MDAVDTATTALRLSVAALATWRVAHLLAFEDGPFAAVARLRAALGRWGHPFDCFYCLSLWVAVAFAPWVASGWLDGLCFTLAISGAACLLHRATGQPLEMQPLTQEDHDHGMLRTDEGAGRGAGSAGD